MRDFFGSGVVQAVADRRVRELWEGSFGSEHRIDSVWRTVSLTALCDVLEHERGGAGGGARRPGGE
jgi:hypothetical protein